MVMVQTPVQQLLKLSVLVEHYFEHQHLDEDISIADYLSIHYFSDVKHGDHGRDMQLPFKQYSASSLIFTFSPLPLLPVSSVRLLYTEDNQQAIYYSLFYKSLALFNIWQPPRIA